MTAPSISLTPSTGMLVRTRPEWKNLVTKLKHSRDEDGLWVISYDSETLDRGYPDIGIVGISVGWFEGDGSIAGAYVPLGHSTGELHLTPRDINAELKELLENPALE